MSGLADDMVHAYALELGRRGHGGLQGCLQPQPGRARRVGQGRRKTMQSRQQLVRGDVVRREDQSPGLGPSGMYRIDRHRCPGSLVARTWDTTNVS